MPKRASGDRGKCFGAKHGGRQGEEGDEEKHSGTGTEPEYRCPVCPSVFDLSNKNGIRGHLDRQHRIRNRHCTFSNCVFIATREGELEDHRAKIHQVEKEFKCGSRNKSGCGRAQSVSRPWPRGIG